MSIKGKTALGRWLTGVKVGFSDDDTGRYFSDFYFFVSDDDKALLNELDIENIRNSRVAR